MKLSFYLKTPKEKISLIVISISNRKRHVFSTGESILLTEWDKNKQFPKQLKTNLHKRQKLNYLKSELEKFITQKEITGQSINKDVLKNKLNELKGIDQSKGSLFTELKNFIDSNPLNLKDRSIDKYSTLLNIHLKPFLKADKNLKEIDIDFFYAFEKHLSQSLADSSCQKYTQALKAFLKYCYERNITTNDTYKKMKETLKEYEQEIIHLTPDELSQLEMKVFKKPHLERIRDTFLFSCYTGLRYSDLLQLAPSKEQTVQLISNNILRLKMTKTEKTVSIPLTQKAIQILEKYGYRLPVISNQKLNAGLKDVAKGAKLNRLITLTKKQKNRIEKTPYPMHEVLSIHDARKTFVTLSLKRGINFNLIMKMTGHTDYNTFKKYLQIMEEDLVEAMKAWDSEGGKIISLSS